MYIYVHLPRSCKNSYQSLFTDTVIVQYNNVCQCLDIRNKFIMYIYICVLSKSPVKLYWFSLKYSYPATIKNFVMYIALFFQKTPSKYITPYTARTSTRQNLATNITVINITCHYQYVLTKLPIKVYSRIQLSCNI